MSHKSGFVNIIGNPNAGKSTLMNALVDDQLSIITPKAQTTRHRIIGILNQPDYQIVFSDTPGLVNPHYKLQESMMTSIHSALQDADVFILLSDLGEDFKNSEIIEQIKSSNVPIILLLNKIDLSNQEEIATKLSEWKQKLPMAQILPVSALHKFNMDAVIAMILEHLPEAPPYYPKDEVSDRNLRFFVSEIIREKILLHYQKEIPYSVEIVVESYVEEKNIDKIRALIYVERESQKAIIIGNKGAALKRVGKEARQKMEKFLGKQVFLELYVKVMKDWRDNEKILKRFGYEI
ncbi:MAG: GTPase Era [Bacteroidales bacterium]|jgi:GTP-binding protein Era|nr:GTPase Era [Bacteroidales bacterium]